MPKTTEALTYTEEHSAGRKPTVHTIRVIEYYDRVPHSIVTDHSAFDCETCGGTLYYHDSGGGMRNWEHQVNGFCEPVPPRGQIWIADGVKLTRWVSDEQPAVPVDDAMLLAMGYRRLKRPLLLKVPYEDRKTRNPFEAGEEHDGHFIYCSICKETFLDDDESCGHWRSTSGGEIGSGAEEPSRKEFFAAMDWLRDELERDEWKTWRLPDGLQQQDAVMAIESVIREPKYLPLRDCLHSACRVMRDAEDANVEDGIAWLSTLRKGTPEANATTLEWIAEWRKAEPERALAKRREAAIKELCALGDTEEQAKLIKAALGIERRRDLDAIPLERIEAAIAQFRPKGVQADE